MNEDFKKWFAGKCHISDGGSVIIVPSIEDAFLAGRASAVPAIVIPDLNDDLIDILGKPNFVCGPIAHRLVELGHNIPPKSEQEQAYVLHWLLKLYAEHGSDWPEYGSKELKRAAAPLPPEGERK